MSSFGLKARRALAFIVFLLALLFLLFVFFATKNALEVWERLQAMPTAIFYAYALAIAAFVIASGWLIYKLLRRPQSAPTSTTALDETTVHSQLAQAQEAGIDTQEIQKEIEQLTRRKATGRIYIALFGEVSTGKSSLINALLPDAKVDISARAGSTQTINEYIWQSPAGDELVLTDLPGRNEADSALESVIEEEARRAQLVIYMCDSDLSRNQLNDVIRLSEFNKPLILCINKSDRLIDTDKAKLEKHIKQQVTTNTPITLVFVQSGGEEEVVLIGEDKQEHTITRARKVEVESLIQAIQSQIDDQSEQLHQLRDASVFVLMQQKLDSATAQHRDQEGEKIVKSGTKKAVFGALASVSPGSDLIIQGLIGTTMVKDLCKLHDASFKDIDIDQFFDFSQGHIKKSTPLLLALAGNAMKAFPGIGTVTGGITHAFAYGLIFDALGRAVQQTLKTRGELKPVPAAISFTDYLGQNMNERKTDVAKMIFEQIRNRS